MPSVIIVVLAFVTFSASAQQPARQPGQRTEEDARRQAQRNREERARQRQQTGVPVELIPSYVKAVVGPIPESLAVNPFYKKYADAMGIPVISSERVPDDALLVARDIINTMLAARPDVRKAMIDRKWRTGVIAETEMTADIPEYANNKRPGASRGEPVTQADRDYHANRSRGLGGIRRPARKRTCSVIRELATSASTSSCTSFHTRSWRWAALRLIRSCSPRSKSPTTPPWRPASTNTPMAATLRDNQPERVLGGGRAVVVLLELRRVFRRQHPGRYARRVQGLRSPTVRPARPRLRHASHPDGRFSWQARPFFRLPGDASGAVVACGAGCQPAAGW